MAPKKASANSTRSRDKNRRRSRRLQQEVENAPLFKLMGQLCGEECEYDLAGGSEGGARARREGKRREALEEADADPTWSPSDEEYDELRESPPLKSGRVGKAKPPRKSASRTGEMSLTLGVQKAIRYICEALDFGVQSGYLVPKNVKGSLLRVSSDLLESRTPQRVVSGAIEPRQNRKRSSQLGPEESSDASRQKKRSAVSRSRSRSTKRRQQVGGKRLARSQSEKPDQLAKLGKPEHHEPEHDEMENSGKDALAARSNRDSSSRDQDEHDDAKSTKSAKSAKSTLNSDSQNASQEKKHTDDDAGSVDDDEDDEDDKK